MYFEMLSSEEIEKIDSCTKSILSETGVLVKSERGLKLFERAGARVDHGKKRVRIPAELIKRCLNSVPGAFRLWSRNGEKMIDLQDGQPRGHNVGGCVRMLDRKSRRPRPATHQDLIDFTRLIDALQNIHVCRPVVYPEEYPAQMRDIHIFACMLQNTEKPYGVSAYSVRNLGFILDIAALVAGDQDTLRRKPFLWGSICPDSPLSYSESTTDILITYAEHGLPIAVAPCPVSGGTSPVTLAGTLVQENAEFLTGLVLSQIVNPGNPIKYTARPIPMDMKTATAAFGAVEMGMMSSAIVQLSKLYRVCSDVYGLGTSSANMDEQAGFEKILNAVLPAISHADLIAAAGMLDGSMLASMEQLVLDNEMLGSIFRIGRGISVTDNTLAMDVITRVGPGGDYLLDPHTSENLRDEHYISDLCFRAGNTSWEKAGYKTIHDAAEGIVTGILDTHTPAILDSKITAEIGSIIRKAGDGHE